MIIRCPVSFLKLISSGLSDPFRYFKDRAILKIYLFISFWENGFILTNYLGLQGHNESTLYYLGIQGHDESTLYYLGLQGHDESTLYYLGLQGHDESTLYSSNWARNLSKQKIF